MFAGPLWLGNLPRQGDVLGIDGSYFPVLLVEWDYKTQDDAKAYVKTLGNAQDYMAELPGLLKG